MTLALHAYARLSTWPDLRQVEPSCGLGQALASVHGEIAHFHSGRDVDLLLTERAIRRLARDLRASDAVRIVPRSQWVTIRLDASSDIDLLLTLVSVALQAQQQRIPRAADTAPVGCNDQRGAGFVKVDLGSG
ncbi:luciferase family protein [Streptomyces sp. NPDC047000]|uniref:luciferase domain-containing protein n=1 Tax=Streptomyces sp. NPDC047000 TaxID=3155474 RepID=UPI0033E1391B